MENKTICQSCGMPLETEAVKGTKKNGLKSNEYCKYCYEDGAFKNPTMTLEDMKNNVKSIMKKLELKEDAIQNILPILQTLKRWKYS
jgi:hypothetical protein